MVQPRRRRIAGLAGVAVLVALAPAAAQIHEDRQEPAQLGIGDLRALVVPPAAYVGNETCAACHAEAYRTWLGTRHARTFVWLESELAARIAAEAGIEAEVPRRSAFCLECHATAANVAAQWREPGFRMGEGVACEKCHGPGALHAAAYEGGRAAEMPVPRPDEQVCLGCHAFKPSHAEVPTNGTFEFSARWKEIAHPEDRDD